MSDTPRTEALVLQDLNRPVEDAHDHLLDHARRLERELTLAEGKLAYLRSQRAGEMGEKLYRLEQELNEAREEIRLRHEADVKASVTHTLQDVGFDEWIARELPRATGFEIDLCRTVWLAARQERQ
jgi:transposase